MMSSDHKATNAKYRGGYDRIRWGGVTGAFKIDYEDETPVKKPHITKAAKP